MGAHSLAHKVDKGRKALAAKANREHQAAKRSAAKARQAGHALRAAVQRTVRKATKVVKDAYHSTKVWVKKHKNAIIEVVATVATIAATVTLGPVGGLLVGMAINVAKDAAGGKIHSLGDLGKSVLSGAETGAIGLLTGGLGGAVAGKLAANLGKGIVGRVVSGALAGAISGGSADIGQQLIATGHVNWSKTAMAVGYGAAAGSIAGGLVKGPSCHSFLPKTPVLMADGKTEPIGKIKIGDKVWSTDPVTGVSGAQAVTLLHINHDSDLADVSVKNTKTGKVTVLHTTWHHPFWSADAHAFVEAQYLTAGTHLRDVHGKTTEMVTAVKVWTGLKWMRDLTVANVHTYYVMAGTTPVLVHNCGGPTEDDAKLARNRAEDIQSQRNDYPNAQNHGTTAVIGVYNKTAGTWTNHVAINGEGQLPAGVLNSGEKFVQGAGHAEQTILNNLGPDEVVGFGGTSRNICMDTCYPMLNGPGMKFGGAGYLGGRADKTPFSLFWQEEI